MKKVEEKFLNWKQKLRNLKLLSPKKILLKKHWKNTTKPKKNWILLCRSGNIWDSVGLISKKYIK
jgi:hypothetical protein